MSERTADNKLLSYKCGRCGMDIFYRKDESPEVPCPECGWLRMSKQENNVPGSFKFNLSQF